MPNLNTSNTLCEISMQQQQLFLSGEGYTTRANWYLIKGPEASNMKRDLDTKLRVGVFNTECHNMFPAWTKGAW